MGTRMCGRRRSRKEAFARPLTNPRVGAGRTRPSRRGLFRESPGPWARRARLLRESEFQGLFPDCEAGAEPPFGGLFALPVVVDSTLAESDRIVFRAGSHEEAIEMRYEDFYRLENGPRVGAIGRAHPSAPEVWTDRPEPPAR
jgi:hypothetical protein